MVRAGGVVSRRLRRVVANENRTCILDQRQITPGDGDVFWSNAVRPIERLFASVGNEHRAPGIERLFRDGIFIQRRTSLPAFSNFFDDCRREFF